MHQDDPFGIGARGHTPATLKRPLDTREQEMCSRLRRHVEMLSEVIGIRNTDRPGGLEAAARYIEDHLRKCGYEVRQQTFRAGGQMVRNIDAQINGTKRPNEVLLLGAHYDSVDCPAANDNGSGVAGVLEAATQWVGKKFKRSVRLVLFVNEEPPYYKGKFMGSVRYARRCRERGERLLGLINLETIGCYYANPGSQVYPDPRLDRIKWLLPRRGNFVVFTGNFKSWRLTVSTWRRFKKRARFPAMCLPSPEGIMGPDMSDQWSFWQEGYPAIMVTDTAFLRYPYYHKQQDLPRNMNFECMTRVVRGVIDAAGELAGLQP
jgi:Zn-dependent M28 family amino/carboxypeptidase